MARGRLRLWSVKGRHRDSTAPLDDFICRVELITLILLDLISLGRADTFCTKYPGDLTFKSSFSCFKREVLPTPFLP